MSYADEQLDVELAMFGRHLTRDELDLIADELRRLGYTVTEPPGLGRD